MNFLKRSYPLALKVIKKKHVKHTVDFVLQNSVQNKQRARINAISVHSLNKVENIFLKAMATKINGA